MKLGGEGEVGGAGGEVTRNRTVMGFARHPTTLGCILKGLE